MFIVFEGGDGCGKTSAIEYVKNKINEFYPCTVFTDWYGEEGQKAKQTFVTTNFTDEERLQIVSQCRKNALKEMQKAEQHSIILYDRFILSTYAYQSVLGIGKLPVFTVMNAIKQSLKDYDEPNLHVIIRGVDYDTQQRRIANRSKQDVFDYLPRDKYEKLQKFYQQESKKVLTLHLKNPKLIMSIDNTGSLQDLYQQLDNVVNFVSRSMIYAS